MPLAFNGYQIEWIEMRCLIEMEENEKMKEKANEKLKGKVKSQWIIADRAPTRATIGIKWGSD